jgi:uncharacterized membrane protein
MFTRLFHWSGYALGFALGGFFDGILLHQILQWHHLLSGLEGEAFRDLRVQILADGIFHALMYVIAAAGLWLLWRARREFAESGADRLLVANALLGFGGWHIIDSFVSHWITGIHRIRMDSGNPLMWDLIWFFAFGVVPVLIGIWMRRSGPRGIARGGAVASALAILVTAGAVWASLPPPGVSSVMVYFRPGTTPAQVFAAADAVEASVLWSDTSGELWAFDLPEPGRTARLYGQGALFVGNSLFPMGCLAWSRAS